MGLLLLQPSTLPRTGVTPGCAQVYKGMYDSKPVAVKVCRQADLKGPGMRQFQQECIILQSLKSDYIVSFVGACTWKVCRLGLY